MALDTKSEPPPCPYTQFACIGTGFSGIGLGATLKRWYNIDDIQFFEKNPSLGGTWWNNQYPGCACDVPSALYSYSFARNPDWSRVLPPQAELWEYLDKIATDYDLHARMRFGVEVRRAVWYEDRARWRLTVLRLEDGEEFFHECQFLFGAVGQLARPRALELPGLENFRGDAFHSAQWRHDVDLEGKRVVVLGNGCTGCQLVPAIAPKTEKVTHVVRAKHWILPGIDADVTPFLRKLFRIPGFAALSRFIVFASGEYYHRAFFLTPFSGRLRKSLTENGERYMRKKAPPEYHDMLIPTDFEVGCKRRIFDPGYLEALHRENVELTDAKLEEVVPEGVRLADGRLVEADVIVGCIGFQTHDFLGSLEIVGVGGETAKQHWAKFGGAPEAYNCSVMSGFPNFFTLLGPNSVTAHTSTVIAIENSINYALRIIKPLLDGKGTTAEVSFDAEQRYIEDSQAALSQTIHATGCGSWYVTKLEDGRQWNSQIYPWSQAHYWWRSVFPVWKDWEFRGPVTKRKRSRFALLGRLVLSMGLIGALAWLLSTYLLRNGSLSKQAVQVALTRHLAVIRKKIADLKVRLR